MKIDCAHITEEVLARTRVRLEQVYNAEAPPRVVLFYVGNDPLTDIYIEHKKAIAKSLGINFEVVSWEHPPLFQQFASKLRALAHAPSVHGVIVQRPLPPELSSSSIEDYIPTIKEVEGQKYKSPFIPPPGKAVLSILKTLNNQSWAIKPTDAESFKKIFKKQFVVIAGRGITTGRPIAQSLLRFKVPTIITHSKTPYTDLFYKQADVIVTATGQPILNSENIKQGATLINFGYRKEKGRVYGDYRERDVRDIAGNYTSIMGGTGPLLIAYLMENIVLSYGAQMKKR